MSSDKGENMSGALFIAAALHSYKKAEVEAEAEFDHCGDCVSNKFCRENDETRACKYFQTEEKGR